MVHRATISAFFFCALVTGFAAAQMQQPVARPDNATIQQWQSRRFGMFIHFGLYSMLGGVWQGKRVNNGTYSEQIQAGAKIPEPQYEALAGQFRPEKWDPDAVVQLAQDAGMQFIVLTSKHHDGFNMFGTKQTKFNVVDASPYGRDIVKSLADACARHHMAFGVYYSTIDWHFGDTPVDGNDNPISAEHESFNARQLQELMTGYGPLTEIWFDMGHPTKLQSRHFADVVHRFQPNCMVSGRVWNSEGDFLEMGDDEIPNYISDEPWESPASIYQETWGYRSWQKRAREEQKIQEHIKRLVTVVSRGGNYILNIGPKGDGSIVDHEAAILRGVGKWVEANKEAIYGTQPQPFRNLDFGYATLRGNRLFLFLEKVPADGMLRLPGLRNQINKASVLGHDGRSLEVHAGAIRAPQNAGFLPVVAADVAGPIRVDDPAVRAGADGVVRLRPDAADHYFNENGEGYSDPKTLRKQAWTFAVAKPGKYSVTLKAAKGRYSRVLSIRVNGRELPVVVHGGNEEKWAAGEVQLIADGDNHLSVERGQPAERGEVLDVPLTEIELRPLP